MNGTKPVACAGLSLRLTCDPSSTFISAESTSSSHGDGVVLTRPIAPRSAPRRPAAGQAMPAAGAGHGPVLPAGEGRPCASRARAEREHLTPEERRVTALP